MEADQQQQEQQARSAYFQSPMNLYGSSIVTLTNPEGELYKLELVLRNLKEDRDGNVEKVGKQTPLVNEEGVRSVLGQVQSLMNQVSIMGNVTDRQIDALMMNFSDTLIKDLMMNRYQYKIVNSVARDKILTMATNHCVMTMSRAKDADDKKFWKGSVQEIRSTVDVPQKKGILSSVVGWGGR